MDAKNIAWIPLVTLLGCSTPDVERAWAQCLAFGGSPKFMVAGEVRKAECAVGSGVGVPAQTEALSPSRGQGKP